MPSARPVLADGIVRGHMSLQPSLPLSGAGLRPPAPRRHGAPLAVLLLALALLTLWRAFTAWHTAPPLFTDESQYWLWSHDPAWGYFSKPPMVAWLIALSTSLLGHGELAIRAASLLLYPATALMIYLCAGRLARHLPPASAAARHGPWLAALLFATLPMVSMGSWLITTDAALLFFWSVALYFYLRALTDDRSRDWLLLGVAVGLGMLSKYTMVFFVLGALGHMLTTATLRPRLARPMPWLAALLALAVFAPNLGWNAANGFVSIHHTAEISQLGGDLLQPDALADFLSAQFAVFGPLSMAVLVWLGLRPQRLLRDPALAPLVWFVLLPLGYFLLHALLSRAFANWAAFAYVAAAPLVVFWLLARGRGAWVIAALVINLAFGAAFYHWHDLARALGVELNRKIDPYSRVLGWRELGDAVAGRLAEHPGARLLTSDRTEFAQLAYYAGPRARPAYFLNVSGRISHHFAMTADVAHAPMGAFLWVTDHPAPEPYTRGFAQARELAPIRVPVYPDLVRAYRVFLLHDFKTYP